MKKFVSMLLASALVLCGCGKGKKLSPAEIATQHADAVMNCLKTGDTSELEKLFCESVSQSHDLHSEILEAIDFIDGNIIDEGRWIGLSEGGRSVDNGKTTKLYVDPQLYNLKTDTGKVYLISFTSYVIYAGHPENIGITYITVKDVTSKDLNAHKVYRVGDFMY